MLKGFKKLVSLVLVLAVSMVVSVPAFAEENTNKSPKGFIAEVYSEEFPDAYIEQSFSPDLNLQKKFNSSKALIGTVKATVYVEEKYDDINGEKVRVDSRLLSKKEVDRIGKNKFDRITTSNDIMPADWNSKGKLDLFLQLYRNNNTSYAIEYQPNCTASWTWATLGSNSNTPAPGDDFLGFVWGGNYDYLSDSITAIDNSGNERDTYEADSEPNKGHVWGFLEGSQSSLSHSFIESIGAGLTMYKNKLVGGGNTTSLVCKYIHTYQDSTGSVSISTSGVGFSLSNTSKQWSLITRIPSLTY